MDKYKLELSFEANVTDADPAVIFASEFAVMTNVYLLFEQVLFSTVDVVMADNIYVINVKKSIILDFIIIKKLFVVYF